MKISSKTWLSLALVIGLTNGRPQNRRSNGASIVATDSQMIVREDDGEVRTGVDTGDSFRAETRNSDGSVRGVYGWKTPEGKSVSFSFTSDSKNGYRASPNFDQFKEELPPFPRSLYGDEEDIKASRTIADDDFVVLEDLTRNVDAKADIDDIDGVFVGEGEEEDEEEGEQQEGGGGEATEGSPFLSIPGDLKGVIKPGTPVAQSSPTVTAISGIYGVAQAVPMSRAVVGPGGIAITLPNAQALVGPGGLAISAPSSTSQAGAGGIALAGGRSTAVASIQSGAEPAGDDDDGDNDITLSTGGEPGFFKRSPPQPVSNSKTPPISSFTAFPVIANYFFGFHPDYYGAASGLRGIYSPVPSNRRLFAFPSQQIPNNQRSFNYGAPNFRSFTHLNDNNSKKTHAGAY